MNNVVSIEKAIRRYQLRIIRRGEDDGAFRTYTLARKGSGSRGGYPRNIRHIVLSVADDLRLREIGLLREAR